MATLVWIFFNDVDLVNLRGARYFILGFKPRKLLRPEDLKKPLQVFEYF